MFTLTLQKTKIFLTSFFNSVKAFSVSSSRKTLNLSADRRSYLFSLSKNKQKSFISELEMVFVFITSYGRTFVLGFIYAFVRL